MREIKFGMYLVPDDVASAQSAAQRAEREGFFSVSLCDHFFSPIGTPDSPQLECFTALTAIAAVTDSVRLVPSVAAVSFRSPALLAKIISTLDLASNGRFICGLGAGWQDEEYIRHGYAFPPLSERLEQLRECIDVLKAMWTQDAPSYQGKHFSIEQAYNQPRPVQQPHPPIMIGGSGRGVLEIAAQHADILNMIPPASNGKSFADDNATLLAFDMARMKRRIALLHRLMNDIDRDPGDIELSGMVLTGLSDKPGDPELRATAAGLGFPDYATAQRSPIALFGTPEEVVDELRARIDDTGVTYYLVVPTSETSWDLFVDGVMPAFN
jgi:probable F420-dependent oxidoreductase